MVCETNADNVPVGVDITPDPSVEQEKNVFHLIINTDDSEPMSSLKQYTSDEIVIDNTPETCGCEDEIIEVQNSPNISLKSSTLREIKSTASKPLNRDNHANTPENVTNDSTGSCSQQISEERITEAISPEVELPLPPYSIFPQRSEIIADIGAISSATDYAHVSPYYSRNHFSPLSVTRAEEVHEQSKKKCLQFGATILGILGLILLVVGIVFAAVPSLGANATFMTSLLLGSGLLALILALVIWFITTKLLERSESNLSFDAGVNSILRYNYVRPNRPVPLPFSRAPHCYLNAPPFSPFYSPTSYNLMRHRNDGFPGIFQSILPMPPPPPAYSIIPRHRNGAHRNRNVTERGSHVTEPQPRTQSSDVTTNETNQVNVTRVPQISIRENHHESGVTLVSIMSGNNSEFEKQSSQEVVNHGDIEERSDDNRVRILQTNSVSQVPIQNISVQTGRSV